MEIIATELEWTQTDREIWSRFLDTPTGRRLIPKLLEFAPALLEKGDTNAILIRSGEIRGLQSTVTNILSMARADMENQPPAKVIDSYPPLEDDSAWEDGKKLVEEPTKPTANDIL